MQDFNYFISRTDTRLESIESKIDALTEFRVKTISESRLVAFIVSGVCGFISLLASGILCYMITTKLAAN